MHKPQTSAEQILVIPQVYISVGELESNPNPTLGRRLISKDRNIHIQREQVSTPPGNTALSMQLSEDGLSILKIRAWVF